MNCFKKLISAALAVSMTFALVQIPSLAGMTAGAEKAKIELVAMETDSSSQYGYKEAENLDLSSAQKDDIFYIGVKITNLNKVEQYVDNNLGIMGLTFGFTYNNSYISPQYTATRTFMNNITNTLKQGDTLFYADNDGYTYTLGDTALQDGDGIYDTLPVVNYSVAWQGVADGVSNSYVFSDGDIIAIIPFKFTANAPTEATKLFEFSNNQTLYSADFGLANQMGYRAYQLYGKPTDGATINNNDILNILQYDASGVDFFSASDALTNLAIKVTNPVYAIPTQYQGLAFNPGNLTLRATIGDNTNDVAKDAKGVSYYYGATGKSDVADLTAMPATMPSDTTLDGKCAYAAYTYKSVTKVVELGAIDNQADSITKIEAGTGNSVPTSAITGSDVNLNGLKVKLTWASNKTGYDAVAIGALGTYGLGVYKKTGNATGDSVPVTEVTSTTKYSSTAGTDTFYVVSKPTSGSTRTTVNTASTGGDVYYTFNVTVSNNKTTISDKEGTPKLTYGKGYKIDLTGLKFKAKQDSDTTDPTEAVSFKDVPGGVIFFLTDATETNPTYEDGVSTVITSGTTKYDPTTMEGKKIWAVPANNTTNGTTKPIEVGTLATRKIAASATGNTTTNINTTGLTYGGTVEDILYTPADNTGEPAVAERKATVTLTYDNGDTETFTYDPDAKDFVKAEDTQTGTPELKLATEGVTLKIGDGAVTPTTTLTPSKDKKLTFVYKDGTHVTPVAESNTALTIDKKDVNVTVETTDPPIKEEYDGTTDLETADDTTLKNNIKINSSDLETADDALAEKIGVSGLTFKYADKKVGTDKTINVTGTAVAAKAGAGTDADVTDFNSKYNLVLSADDFKNGALKTLKGQIKAKTLNVTSITGVPSVEVGATTGLTGTSTLTLKNNSTTDTNSNIVKGDKVTLTYKYEYKAADVKAAGKPVVTITATGKVGDTDLGISSTDAGNYTLNTTMPVTKGTVDNKKLDRLEVSTAPQAQTYPTTKLDLSGMKIKIHFENETAEPEPISVADFIADKGVISLVDATGETVSITANNITNVIELPIGNTTLNITYDNNENKKITQTVTVNEKPIKLSDITFTASKVYGQDEVDGEATFSTEGDKGLVAADNGKVQITATYTFTDEPESAGNDKNVTISNIALTGDAAGNYVIVNDDGTKITATTSKNIDTGVISQATPAAPEAAPTISVDPATNNIIVGGPLGENIEYSIDGGQKWQSDVTFTGLTKGQPYTVKARVKASEDGNYAPSEPTAASEPATTYKYHVAIYKKNAKEGSEPAYEVYTNTTSVASKAELNELLPKKISNLKEFFTDLAATIKVEYPYTLAAENVFYYTTSSGGGGGGSSSSVTITLDKTSVNGEVGNSEKVTATIKGSTATPKWTSSNEKVATVDENGNITFVGEGKATVKINVGGTVKNVAVTVTASTATPVPTKEPTVEPTDKPSEPDKPIIDVNYTKPYASGYEDDTFRPENKITRAELAAMIARLSYGDDLPDGAYVSSFPDVEGDAWFNKYVGYLEDKDVLSGYEDGTFRPYDTVTRSEISTVIARAQRYELIPYSGIFADVTDSDWAKDYIQTLASQGIISGYEDGTFGPYLPLSRAEAVTIINNVLAPSTPIVTFTPNDIAGHWAEANIILAVNERMLGGAAVPVPVPEDTAPEATEVPAEEVVPEGELDPTVKDEPAVPVNPEAGAVTDEEQKFIVK